MRGICLGRNGLIEVFLYNLRTKIDEYVGQVSLEFVFCTRSPRFSYLYAMDTSPSDPQYRSVCPNVLSDDDSSSAEFFITNRKRTK